MEMQYSQMQIYLSIWVFNSHNIASKTFCQKVSIFSQSWVKMMQHLLALHCSCKPTLTENPPIRGGAWHQSIRLCQFDLQMESQIQCVNSRIPDLSLSLSLSLSPCPKSSHSWDLWYPIESGVVNQTYYAAKNLKGQHTWPISNLQSTAKKNQRIFLRRTTTTRHITDFAKSIAAFAYNLSQVLPRSICIEFSSWLSYKTCPITLWASSLPTHPTPPHSK